MSFAKMHNSCVKTLYRAFLRPGNRSPCATNVVVLGVLFFLIVVIELRLFNFTTDRRQTAYRLATTLSTIADRTVSDFQLSIFN